MKVDGLNRVVARFIKKVRAKHLAELRAAGWVLPGPGQRLCEQVTTPATDNYDVYEGWSQDPERTDWVPVGRRT